MIRYFLRILIKAKTPPSNTGTIINIRNLEVVDNPSSVVTYHAKKKARRQTSVTTMKTTTGPSTVVSASCRYAIPSSLRIRCSLVFIMGLNNRYRLDRATPRREPLYRFPLPDYSRSNYEYGRTAHYPSRPPEEPSRANSWTTPATCQV